MKSEARFWRVFALPATVVIALTMLAVALVLLGGVALAAPPQQEPVCDIDVEGKTLDEVRAELEACAAQLGVGAQAINITVEKWANPGTFVGTKAVTFTVSVQGGSGFFNFTDDVSHLGDQFIGDPTVVAGTGLCTRTGNTIVGTGYGQPFKCTFAMTLTAPTRWTTNTVQGEDFINDVSFSETVGLAGLNVDISKTADPTAGYTPGGYITYTIVIRNNESSKNICLDMAENVRDGLMLSDYLWEHGTYGSLWYGTGGFGTSGTNYKGAGSFTPPGSATFGTFYRNSFLYWHGCVEPGKAVTLTVPLLVEGGYSSPLTNTAEFWLWDEAWEATDEGHGYHRIEVVSQPPGRGIFLPIIIKAYTFP
jgi:hypothetical protein